MLTSMGPVTGADVDGNAEELVELIAGRVRKGVGGGARGWRGSSCTVVGEDLRHALVQAIGLIPALSHAALNGEHELLEEGQAAARGATGRARVAALLQHLVDPMLEGAGRHAAGGLCRRR